MRPAESFVEQPVRSLQTMLRVIASADKRLPSIVPDGIYGPATMNAISAFQRQNGLQVTGITNQETWQEIVTQYEPALVRMGKAQPIEVLIDPDRVFTSGEQNPYIYLLQAMLMQLSNDHPSIPAPGFGGILDDETMDSLRAFQKLSDLPETGEFDRITWKHLVLQFTLNANHNQARHRSLTGDVSIF